MNLCHDCNSSYATPGSCNCFAPGGKRAPTPAVNRHGTIDGGAITVTPPPWSTDINWTVRAEKCANCGGVYAGSHVCGYYNPIRSPFCGGVVSGNPLGVANA